MEAAWIDLLNSDWHDHLGSGRSEDRLENPEWLEVFLSRWQRAARRVPTSEIRCALRELRALIQRMVNSVVSGQGTAGKDWKSLNSTLAASPAVRRLQVTDDRYRLELVPVAENLDSILADIALSFAEVFAHGDPTRIKLCENDDCRWVFYDRSRNRTRRWCEGSACGNLMKVRRFRARKKRARDSKSG